MFDIKIARENTKNSNNNYMDRIVGKITENIDKAIEHNSKCGFCRTYLVKKEVRSLVKETIPDLTCINEDAYIYDVMKEIQKIYIKAGYSIAKTSVEGFPEVEALEIKW